MEFGQELSFHLNANAHVGMLPTVGDVAWKNWLHGEHVPNQWGWTRCPALAGCTIAAWITRLQQSITHTVEQAIRPITNIFKIITTILHPLNLAALNHIETVTQHHELHSLSSSVMMSARCQQTCSANMINVSLPALHRHIHEFSNNVYMMHGVLAVSSIADWMSMRSLNYIRNSPIKSPINLLSHTPWHMLLQLLQYTQARMKNGLPLSVFEKPDWSGLNQGKIPSQMCSSYHSDLLHDHCHCSQRVLACVIHFSVDATRFRMSVNRIAKTPNDTSSSYCISRRFNLVLADFDSTLHGYLPLSQLTPPQILCSLLLVGVSKLLQIRSWCPLILQSSCHGVHGMKPILCAILVVVG